MSYVKDKFDLSVANLPHSGGGGLHCALLGSANLGVRAGMSRDEIFGAIRPAIYGSRPVSDREIFQAIDKAIQDGTRGAPKPRSTPMSVPPSVDAGTLLRAILAKGEGRNEADLRRDSPVAISPDPSKETVQFLGEVYDGEDLLFLGRHVYSGRDAIKQVGQWIDTIGRSIVIPPPHFIPNPLSGEKGLTKDQKPTYRGDSCVREHRFALVEFDQTPVPLRTPEQVEAVARMADRTRVVDGTEREHLQGLLAWPRREQLRFYTGLIAAGFPIVALIDSGNKSIHALLQVNARDHADWDNSVRNQLFKRFLVPCGADSRCQNASRLSRLPGAVREDKGRRQSLLYLNPRTEERCT